MSSESDYIRMKQKIAERFASPVPDDPFRPQQVPAKPEEAPEAAQPVKPAEEPAAEPERQQEGSASDILLSEEGPEVSDLAEIPAEPVFAEPEKLRQRGWRPSEKKPPKPKAQEETDEVRTNSLRIPAGLVAAVTAMFPEGIDNKSDAVAAWLYATLPPEQAKKIPVSERVRKAAVLIEDKPMAQISADTVASVKRLETFAQAMNATVWDLWYMVGYLLLDRMGEIGVPSLDKINLHDALYRTLYEEIHGQSKNARTQMFASFRHPSVERVRRARGIVDEADEKSENP